MDAEYSYHVFDEREFRERFFIAVQGDETIVRELLDAANASGPSWTALHKAFEETQAAWQQAVAARDGEAIQRAVMGPFARLLGHLRPVYLTGITLSQIDRSRFPELAEHMSSTGALLTDAEGAPLPGVPAGLERTLRARCLDGRSGGVVILREAVRPFLKAFRSATPRLKSWLSERDLPGEEMITMLLAALVDAKLKGSALLEARDALVGDTHLPKSHRLRFSKPDKLPLAVRREVGKLFGREAPPPPKAKPAPAPDVVSYSPQGQYAVGQQLEHRSFGQGKVVRILDSRRLKVQFDDSERTLAQNLPSRNRPSE